MRQAPRHRRADARRSRRSPRAGARSGIARTFAPYAALAAATLALGCGEEYRFHNAAPLVDALGPVCAADGTRAWVLVSLVDYEGDPVDIFVDWRHAGADWAPAALATPDEAPAGEVTCGPRALDPAWVLPASFGTTGLTTERRSPGRLHVLVLDARGWPEGEAIELRVTPDDRWGREGLPLVSGPFTLPAGTDETWLP